MTTLLSAPYQFNTNRNRFRCCGPGMATLVGSGCFRASRRVFCGPKCPAYVRYAVHTHLPLKKAPQIRWFRSTNKNRFACVTPQRHQRPQLRLLRPRNSPHSDRRVSCALARAMSALNSPMSIPSTPNFQRACIARRCCSSRRHRRRHSRRRHCRRRRRRRPAGFRGGRRRAAARARSEGAARAERGEDRSDRRATTQGATATANSKNAPF